MFFLLPNILFYMNKKITSAMLCLLFAGCTSTAPTDAPDSESSAMSSAAMQEEEKMMDTDTSFSGKYSDIDEENSKITFVGGSSIVDHAGEFTEFDAELTLDESDTSNVSNAQLSITIDMTSAVTDSAGLDNHLLKDDFFDSENYPEATFTSTSITEGDAGMYELTGDFTVKGTTKSMTVPVMITDEYIKGTFELPRKEFGIGNDSYGDKLLNETVPVTIMLMFEHEMMDDNEEMMDEEEGAMMENDQ